MIDDDDLDGEKLPDGHQCRCIVVGDPGTPYERGNRCPHDAPRDAPFCRRCEARHPDDVAHGLTVSQVPL